SGTSLIAGMAAAAGIDMGAELIPGSKGNWRGPFEGRGFVRFPEAGLGRGGGRAPRPPRDGGPRAGRGEARRGTPPGADRTRRPRWGWKDPRTSLFLRSWDVLLPEGAFYLLLYRHPAEVALSLLRRGLDLEVQLDPRIAVQAWMAYNRQLLAFHGACA